ncbi:MAG: hypothetical protein QFB87_01305 [Patescibacteria group bacterium]|nr:hypothetical protein [Patescibacteria group bacterium]
MTNAVCFAYQPEHLPPDTRLPDRAELFAKLRALDLDPFVSLNAEQAFGPDTVQAIGLDPKIKRDHRQIAFEGLGLIVNRLNRSIKSELLAVTELPTLINENAVRKIAWHKEVAAEQVLAPLDLGIPTALVTEPEDVDRFLEQYTAPRFILKPRHGNFGAGTHLLSRHRTLKFYSQHPDLLAKHVIQPAYNFNRPFPTSIKALNRQTAETFDACNRSGITKELRMYAFLSPTGVTTHPAARAVKPSADGKQLHSRWFFVDPESIPNELVTQTERVVQRTAQLTASRAVYAAVDYGYGTISGVSPSWQIIELNALSPGMINYKDNQLVADRLQTMFSQQIRDTIDAR